MINESYVSWINKWLYPRENKALWNKSDLQLLTIITTLLQITLVRVPVLWGCCQIISQTEQKIAMDIGIIDTCNEVTSRIW